MTYEIMRLFVIATLLCFGAPTTSAFTIPIGTKATTTSRTGPFPLYATNSNERMPMNKGSTVALITPMTSTGDIDISGLRRLLQYHVEAKTDNLCILGTTGEASVMSMEERKTVLTTVVEEVKGIIPILVGTGTINPNSVKAMTLQAIDLGCDASLLVTPYYVKPPQRGMIQMFTSMADVGLPLIIYNIPGRAGIDFKDENIAICAQHDNIIGLKDATGDLTRVTNMRRLVGNDFLLYSGDDATSLQFVTLGGDGCISVTANLAPNVMHRVMTSALNGNVDEAEAVNAPLTLLHNKLFVESNPIPAKWCAKRMGLIDTAYCRPPLDEMDVQYEPVLEEALKAAGLI